MPHIIRKSVILGGTTLAVFMTLVHTVNDAMTAILGALLPTRRSSAGRCPPFSLAGGLGSLLGGFLAPRLGALITIVGAFLLTLCPLLAVIATEPGSAAYFVAIVLAGILIFVPVPALVIIAQEFIRGRRRRQQGGSRARLGLGRDRIPSSSGAFRRRSG